MQPPETGLCKRCQDHVIKHSLTSACSLAQEPDEQHTNTCLLHFSVDLWCCRDVPGSYQSTAAQLRWFGCVFRSVWRAAEALERGRVNPSDSLWMQAHANVQQRFWQEMFSFAWGLGEMAVRYPGPRWDGPVKCTHRALKWRSVNLDRTWRCWEKESEVKRCYTFKNRMEQFVIFQINHSKCLSIILWGHRLLYLPFFGIRITYTASLYLYYLSFYANWN